MSGSASWISLFILPQDEGESLISVKILGLDGFEQMGENGRRCEDVVAHHAEEIAGLGSLQ